MQQLSKAPVPILITTKWCQHRHASTTKDGNYLLHFLTLHSFVLSASLNQGTDAFYLLHGLTTDTTLPPRMETLCNISLQHIPLFFLHIDDKAWRNIKTFGHAVVIEDTHALQLISGVSTDTPLPLRMETLCNISLETLSFVLSAHPLQLLSGVSTDTPLPLRKDSQQHFIGNTFLCSFCSSIATNK